MSVSPDVPEIDALRRAIAEVVYADQPQMDTSTYPHGYFPFEEASQPFRDAAYALADEIMVPVRSALDRQANDWDAAILTLRKACCTPAGREQIIHELVRPFDLAGDELDRQAREIVEALRDLCPSTDPTGANDYNEGQQVGWTDAADLIAERYLHGRDEFDGAGCCPEEDGWLRARSRARFAPKEADPR